MDSTNQEKSSCGRSSHKLVCKDGMASDSQLNTTVSSSPLVQSSNLVVKNDGESTAETPTGERNSVEHLVETLTGDRETVESDTSDRDLVETLTCDRDTVQGMNGVRDITAESLSGVEGGTNLHAGMPSSRAAGTTATQAAQANDERSPELSSDIRGIVKSSEVLPGATVQLQPSPTCACAKLLSREELIKLFLDISPVRGKRFYPSDYCNI